MKMDLSKPLALITAILPLAVTAQTPDREELISRFDQEVLSLVPDNYFFPKAAIRSSFLPEKYSAEDLQKIWEDFWFLKEEIFSKTDRSLEYLATAGGPSAGKSTILENTLSSSVKNLAYIDPDRSCLQKMPKTYLADLESGRRNVAEAYDHWREASNLLANVFLAHAIDEGYAIAHGTTMTSPHIGKMLQFLKDRGYTRTLMHINCPDDVRLSTEKIRREGGIFQCTDDDLISKGVDFHKRLPDYLANSDKIVFYYRPKIDETLIAATRKGEKLTIEDTAAFEKVAALYDSVMGKGSFEEQLNLAR